jgi:protein-tyrosine phosphatase
VSNLRFIDEHLWRSAAPTEDGYRNLAALGMTTVVDLRAEKDLVDHEAFLESIGVDLVRMPIRDGQVPPQQVIDDFLAVVHDSPGPVLVHCGAGVGRTGVVVAAYMLAAGHSGIDAVRHNLSVGPPSLEQLSYAVSGGEDPNVVVTGLSRVLDAPRRIWHNIT